MAIERDDKIALGFISVVVAVSTIGILLVIRWFFAGVLGVIDLGTGGVGWKDAFVSSIIISTIFTLVFALVAGDGVIGEFGFMVIAFFVMIVFFTVSIALVI